MTIQDTGDGQIAIGALKGYACDRTIGDVPAEVDRDDWLLSGTVRNILNAAQAGAGFI